MGKGGYLHHKSLLKQHSLTEGVELAATQMDLKQSLLKRSHFLRVLLPEPMGLLKKSKQTGLIGILIQDRWVDEPGTVFTVMLPEESPREKKEEITAFLEALLRELAHIERDKNVLFIHTRLNSLSLEKTLFFLIRKALSEKLSPEVAERCSIIKQEENYGYKSTREKGTLYP